MKKWEILSKLKLTEKNLSIDKIINILLENRGIKTKKEKKEFLNPDLQNLTIENSGIDKKELKKSLLRIERAIKNKEQIIVFGDYDVDGITGSAILWESLTQAGAKVLPYIPNRIDEGYGLSVKGIENLITKIEKVLLIITVDNGIVANDAVDFANKKGIDVIITDHHVPSLKKPKAFAIVHTVSICGAGVSYFLSREVLKNKEHEDKYLELVALATVADLVSLTGQNRIFLRYGLLALQKTKRLGLLELFKQAVIDAQHIGVYEIGYIIAPRLNAMGRLEDAMDSLRLLCTKDKKRAEDLASKLGSTNKERQSLTLESVIHAKEKVSKTELSNLIFISGDYQQGIIGLIAGKLTEEYYRPSIVISRGEKFSKASARSVKGFNIIEFIRSASEFLVDAGGHPMAAGFTVETEKIELLEKALNKKALETLKKEHLERKIRIDLEIPFSAIDLNFYNSLQKLSPFGMGNPEPTFLTKNLIINDIRLVGKEGKHLKLRLKSQNLAIEAIAFGMGEKNGLKIGESVSAVYLLDENEWNGNKTLQLKVKDIQKL